MSLDIAPLMFEVKLSNTDITGKPGGGVNTTFAAVTISGSFMGLDNTGHHSSQDKPLGFEGLFYFKAKVTAKSLRDFRALQTFYKLGYQSLQGARSPQQKARTLKALKNAIAGTKGINSKYAQLAADTEKQLQTITQATKKSQQAAGMAKARALDIERAKAIRNNLVKQARQNIAPHVAEKQKLVQQLEALKKGQPTGTKIKGSQLKSVKPKGSPAFNQANIQRLKGFKGIGNKTVEKLGQALKDGKVKNLADFKNIKIPGLGKSTLAKIETAWGQLGSVAKGTPKEALLKLLQSGTKEQLTKIPGIADKTAEKIIQKRAGGITQIKDVFKTEGKKLEKMLQYFQKQQVAQEGFVGAAKHSQILHTANVANHSTAGQIEALQGRIQALEQHIAKVEKQIAQMESRVFEQHLGQELRAAEQELSVLTKEAQATAKASAAEIQAAKAALQQQAEKLANTYRARVSRVMKKAVTKAMQKSGITRLIQTPVGRKVAGAVGWAVKGGRLLATNLAKLAVASLPIVNVALLVWTLWDLCRLANFKFEPPKVKIPFITTDEFINDNPSVKKVWETLHQQYPQMKTLTVKMKFAEFIRFTDTIRKYFEDGESGKVPTIPQAMVQKLVTHLSQTFQNKKEGSIKAAEVSQSMDQFFKREVGDREEKEEKEEKEEQKPVEKDLEKEKKPGKKLGGYEFKLESVTSKLEKPLNKKLPIKIYLAKEDLQSQTAQTIKVRLEVLYNDHWYIGTGGEVTIVGKNNKQLFVKSVDTYRMNLGGAIFRLNKDQVLPINLYRNKYQRDKKGGLVKKNGQPVKIPNTRVKNEYTFNANKKVTDED